MKTLIETIVAFVLMVSLTGCTSTKAYFSDRGRDAIDILSIGTGAGLGVGAQAGPVHAGALWYVEKACMRTAFCTPENSYHGIIGQWFDAPWIWKSHRIGYDKDQWQYLVFKCMEYDPVSWEREKSISAATVFFPVPFLIAPDDYRKGSYPVQFYTQIDIAVALGFGGRVGFNPGELLDFILGWTTIDIYGDDLEVKKLKEKSNQSSEATSPKRAAPQ